MTSFMRVLLEERRSVAGNLDRSASDVQAIEPPSKPHYGSTRVGYVVARTRDQSGWLGTQPPDSGRRADLPCHVVVAGIKDVRFKRKRGRSSEFRGRSNDD
jgi:hypothetical protein